MWYFGIGLIVAIVTFSTSKGYRYPSIFDFFCEFIGVIYIWPLILYWAWLDWRESQKSKNKGDSCDTKRN